MSRRAPSLAEPYRYVCPECESHKMHRMFRPSYQKVDGNPILPHESKSKKDREFSCQACDTNFHQIYDKKSECLRTPTRDVDST